MRAMTSVAAALLTFAVGACDRPANTTSGDAPTDPSARSSTHVTDTDASASPDVAAASSSPTADSTTGAATGSGATSASGAPDGEPPPVDASCTTDADCALTHTSTSGEHMCCWRCGTESVNKTWLEQFESACKSRPRERGACPRYRCAKRKPTVPVCQAGVCTQR